MLISIPLMKGELPRLEPHLLPNESAQCAKNCHFERGIISPLRTDKFIRNLAISPKTLFRYTKEHWFTWNLGVDAIFNPMAQDKWQRVYFTGNGKPKVTSGDIAIGTVSPAASYDLGIPAPSAQPVIAHIDESTGEEPPEGEADIYDDETRFYIQTYVSRFGEEGAPGKPSDEILIRKPGSSITVNLASPSVNTHNITHTRLYRSVTSQTSSVYMLVAELPIATSQYIDKQKSLNSPTLETWDYDVPDPKMKGLCTMANGICAGFSGNEVMFSEAYLPYAWPKTYRGTTEHEIVAIAPITTSLVVLTKGYPYIFSGVTPSSVNGEKLGSEQACVSKDSVVVISGTVMYASPDGIIAVGNDGAINITDQLITKEQWQEKAPATIKAWAVEGLYVALHKGGGFVFDPVSKDFREIENSWTCGYVDLEEDVIYITRNKALSVWQKGDDFKDLTWKSKEFVTPEGTMLSCAKVTADDPSKVSVKIIADKTTIHTINKGELTHGAFRLPSVRASKWEVEVSGTSTIRKIALATSMEELA